MFKPSTSLRALCQSLFLIAAIITQSLAIPGRGVVYAYAPDPASKTASPTTSAPPVPANAAAPRPEQTPNAPLAAAIAATLTDNVTAATKIAPGGTINYTATITNNGAVVGTDDATNLNFSAPLDANTTLVGGSVHASPIARNDTYNWVGNTQLDTAARSLSAVTANDVAVNAPAGTDTFTITAIAGGATTLGGTVALASPSGAFTYTPPLNRPNLADGASVNDTFTYTITNNADAALTSTGTVTITLTGRVFYLQAGAAGDGRSNTPSGNPATMSTNADKSTDIFYMFSNAGSLSGLFTVDAGQQLLGQGVSLVINIPVLGSTTLFSAAAPTPTTTNAAGNCVTLANVPVAPGNNTLSGFNIGACSAFGIQGANVGTLAVSTLSINNTTGGGLDLTGVGTPTVSVVLGGLTSTGGTKNVNLVGLNGTVTLANGTLSGASGNAFDVTGAGTAGISYSGSITNTTARLINVSGKTGGTIALSGALSGSGSNTGINLTTNTGTTITFTGLLTLNGAGSVFTATGGGTVSSNNTGSTIGATTAPTSTALNVTSTTIGAANLIFQSISCNGATKGIILNTTGAGALNVTGTGTTAGSGGTIQNITLRGGEFTSTSNLSLKNMNFTNANTTDAGGVGVCDDATTTGCNAAVYLSSTTTTTLDRINITGTIAEEGINGNGVNGLSLTNSIIGNAAGHCGDAVEEGCMKMRQWSGTSDITNSTLSFAAEDVVEILNQSGTLALTVTNSTFSDTQPNPPGSTGIIARSRGTGSMILNVVNSNFLRLRSNAFNATAQDTASLDVDVSGSTFDCEAGIGIGVVLASDNASNMVFNIQNNPKIWSRNGIAVSVLGDGTSTFMGRIQNNPSIQVQSGSGTGIGTQVNTNATGVVSITGNTVFGVPNDAGITAIALGKTNASPGGTLNATITGNNVTIGDLATYNIETRSGSGSVGETNQPVCVNVANNVVSDPAGPNGGIFTWRARVANAAPNAQLQVQGFNTNIATTWANNTNTPASGTSQSIAGGGTPISACTATVPTNPALNLNHQPLETAAIEPVAPAPETALTSESSALAMFSTIAQLQTQPTLDNLLTGSFNNVTNIAPSATMPQQVAVTEKPVVANAMHHAISTMAAVAHRLDSIITPTAHAQESAPNAPTSGENVTLNTIATFPAGGKSITIKYSATVNTPPLARQVSTQGTVTANAGAISVLTDDPEPGGATDPTVTLVDTLMTWNGVTSTDWNTVTNWTQPAGGTQYAPGVSNPAINDVVIPNVGNQPNISATDIGLFSMSIANGRTLTIGAARTLTIGGSPGGDLTVDGIITGGFLNLGTGTHIINNAGGTGSIVGGNQATVLSGSTVTLNNNLQMGSLTVNAGGSMNITNRTLSLARAGAALNIPGGATFTTTGSTVVLNGGVAQTIAGIAYNNLTINNSIGAHVTGVTLQGNASVAGVLTLTSSDLATTGAFTLLMPAAATSAPASGATDVVGNVKRTGFVSGGAALSFGNPFNTIRINSGAAPTDINMLIAKNAPVTYAAAVSRSYIITPNGANGPATLRLHYRQVELNGNSETPTINFNLRRGPAWGPATVPTARNVGVAEDNWLENNAVASFSEWTMSNLSPTAAGGAITGRVVDRNGAPVEGAVVRLGGAQSRKIITDANGNYRFDNVETGGFYTVTPSRSNYNFNPFQRQLTQTGNQTEAVFTAESLGDNLNPLDTAEYFVRQQYVDILGREPDEAGFNYWSDQILGCAEDASCTRAQRTGVAAAFFISPESQDTGSFLFDIYAGSLGRRPGFGEFTADRGQVVGGENLDAAKTAFARNFVQRGEFMTKYAGATSGDAFVDALIQSAQSSGGSLGSERDSLISIYGQTADQVASRAAVLRSVADNAAFKQTQYSKAFVLTEYFAYLRRDAEFDGLNFWVGVLNTGDTGNYRGMVCSFTTSLEYQNRFSRIASHSNGECGQ